MVKLLLIHADREMGRQGRGTWDQSSQKDLEVVWGSTKPLQAAERGQKASSSTTQTKPNWEGNVNKCSSVRYCWNIIEMLSAVDLVLRVCWVGFIYIEKYG